MLFIDFKVIFIRLKTFAQCGRISHGGQRDEGGYDQCSGRGRWNNDSNNNRQCVKYVVIVDTLLFLAIIALTSNL